MRGTTKEPRQDEGYIVAAIAASADSEPPSSTSASMITAASSERAHMGQLLLNLFIPPFSAWLYWIRCCPSKARLGYNRSRLSISFLLLGGISNNPIFKLFVVANRLGIIISRPSVLASQLKHSKKDLPVLVPFEVELLQIASCPTTCIDRIPKVATCARSSFPGPSRDRPDRALKNNSMRRGWSQPSKSLPLSNVDLQSIASASDRIQRTGGDEMTDGW
ncbi:hypothetical protein AcV7_004207 [Taiwanofungus camphoratus]|nr:hypothetical protein AcV7_004207 [Antrodia cinnamomea]